MQYLRMWTQCQGGPRKGELVLLAGIFICALNAATFCLRPPRSRILVVGWTNAKMMRRFCRTSCLLLIVWVWFAYLPIYNKELQRGLLTYATRDSKGADDPLLTDCSLRSVPHRIHNHRIVRRGEQTSPDRRAAIFVFYPLAVSVSASLFVGLQPPFWGMPSISITFADEFRFEPALLATLYYFSDSHRERRRRFGH